jgi:hypothetical protein
LKIDDRTEKLIAHAVGLAQNGRLKSTIHMVGRRVFVLNMDGTILMRLKSELVFDDPVSFFADDYEGREFEVRDGHVVFSRWAGDWEREKKNSVPKITVKDVESLWEKYKPDVRMKIIITAEAVNLLDDELSHVELSKAKASAFKIIQRDIYSGGLVTVQKNEDAGMFGQADDSVFGPIGIRTTDLKALFSFTDAIAFYIQDEPWLYFEDEREGTFAGVLSTCVYDELGYTSKSKGET